MTLARAAAARSRTTLTPSGVSATTDFRYLDFEGAAQAVRDAREEAAALGEPSLAPPVPLEDCPERGTLELVLASPRAGFAGVEIYPTFAAKAGALLYGLSKSQACPDGNKRIALIVLRAFLHINGSRLVGADDEIAERILDTAASDPADRGDVIKELTGWLETAIEPYQEEEA